MKSAQQLIDKFSRFEPEVEEALLEKKWEEVKYFVPKKSTAKRGIYWRNFGCFLLAGIILLSSVICILLYQFYQVRVEVSTPKIIEQKNKIPRVQKRVLSKDRERTFRKMTPERRTHLAQSDPTKERQKTENPKKHPAFTSSFQPDTQSKALAIVSKPTTGLNPEKSSPLEVPDNTNKVKRILTDLEKSPGRNMEEEKLIPYVLIPQTFSVLPEEPLYETDKRTPQAPGFLKSWYLEVLSGGNQISEKVVNQSLISSRSIGGLSMGYQFKPRFGLSLQWIIGGDGPNRNEELVSYKKVLSVTPIPGTIFQMDTLYEYQEIKGVRRFEPKMQTAFGLCIDYELYQQRRLILYGSPGFQVRLRSGKSYDHYQLMRDTLNFVKTAGGPSIEHVVESEPLPKKTQYRVFSYGLAPTLSVEYRFWQSLSLVTRITYVKELSQQFKNGPESRRNIAILAGLRLKLK